ncbi:uncharacterized protein LOC121589563 isoform X3 [Anopheles merus]|uniref:uncharacterized protein LOC121589563 isoform X3 n=1 Tax=Anopheles merus TaxID=30066 RepID=UPI001BE46838|nr:uncharacterized protein LOC121589563 isoform X3 [Anopheles merus]
MVRCVLLFAVLVALALPLMSSVRAICTASVSADRVAACAFNPLLLLVERSGWVLSRQNCGETIGPEAFTVPPVLYYDYTEPDHLYTVVFVATESGHPDPFDGGEPRFYLQWLVVNVPGLGSQKHTQTHVVGISLKHREAVRASPKLRHSTVCRFGGFHRIPSSSPLMNRRMLRTARGAIGHRNPDRALARCHCPPGHARNLPESQCVKCIAPNRSLKLESVAPCLSLSPPSKPCGSMLV